MRTTCPGGMDKYKAGTWTEGTSVGSPLITASEIIGGILE